MLGEVVSVAFDTGLVSFVFIAGGPCLDAEQLHVPDIETQPSPGCGWIRVDPIS